MNKFILILLFLLVYSSFVSWVSKSYANDSCATVNVKGMVCDFCARAIESVFGKHDEVRDVIVDLKNGKIVINFNEGKILEVKKITKLITDSGYDLVNIERCV